MSSTKQYSPEQIDQLLAVRDNFQRLLDEIMENPEMDMSDVEDYIKDIIDDCDGQTGLAQANIVLHQTEQKELLKSDRAVAFLLGAVIVGIAAIII